MKNYLKDFIARLIVTFEAVMILAAAVVLAVAIVLSIPILIVYWLFTGRIIIEDLLKIFERWMGYEIN